MTVSQWMRGTGVALFLSACSEPTPMRREIVAAPHPDQSVTATLVEERPSKSKQEGVYLLHLSTPYMPEEARWKSPLFEIKGLKGATLGWRGRVLTVSYAAGEVILARSLWHDPKAPRGTAAYQVEMQLDPRCEGKCF